METFDVRLIPFAILISLIYEDKDEQLLKAADDFMIKKAKLRKMKDKNEEIYSIKALTLKNPFQIPELREGKMEGKDLMVRFKLNDIKLLDIGDFTTKKKKECCVTLEFGFIKVVGNYSIRGTVNNNDFKGAGNAEITLRDVFIDATVEHSVDTEGVHVDHLNLDFDFKILEFDQSGLTIKDIPNSEVRRILNAVGKVYFKQNLKLVSRKLSDNVKAVFNALLKGKSKEQIVDLLNRGYIRVAGENSPKKSLHKLV